MAWFIDGAGDHKVTLAKLPDGTIDFKVDGVTFIQLSTTGELYRPESLPSNLGLALSAGKVVVAN